MPTLEAVLQSENLEKYLGNFVEVGITSPTDLIHLTLDDYHTLGIDDLNDRKRLFQLIQRVKGGDVFNNPGPSRQASAGGGRSSNSRLSGAFQSVTPPSPAPASGLPRPSAAPAPRQSGLPRPAQPAMVSPSPGPAINNGSSRQLKYQPSPSSGPTASVSAKKPAPANPAAIPPAIENFLSLSKELLKIRVAVKLRPLNQKELKKKEVEAMVMPSDQTLVVTEQRVKVDMTKYTETHHFAFDECIGMNVSHDEVYRRTVRPIVSAIFNQAKTTCFAYGQTGSGKTYTMQPLPEMAAQDILNTLRLRQFSHLQVWVSVFEIYLSSVFDLLNERRRLVIREDANKIVHIVGLEEILMTDASVLNQLLATAEKSRSSAPTHANANSSRSHQILQIHLKEGDKSYGKISFIDLAGSEWGADIKDTNRQTRMEGAEINKSLLALKECIRALDRDSGHVPFRGSKLTEVLKDSFTGNSFTIMIACSSPASGSVEHSLNTLRYADRVKELQQPRDKTKPYVDMLTPGNMVNQRPAANDRPQAADHTSLQPRAAMERTKSLSFVNRDEMERDLVAETAQDDVLRMHDELIDVILLEEEQLLTDHRSEIEDTMHLVKEEMKLLDMMDNPGSQIDDYVSQLDVVLQRKIAVISSLREKLKIFQQHLVEESQMVNNFTTHSYSRFY
eukprot:c7763_g1_i1.p1 GENE.c7763_g1_i1~~c7763_g1_i1.p1  ORF type:complete len:675 (+),score=158.47 c7763_g1_i1:102-2126(+)